MKNRPLAIVTIIIYLLKMIYHSLLPLLKINNLWYIMVYIYNYIYIYWLVVEPTPLKNDGVRQWGLFFPTEWKNKIHVPNHQPVYIYIIT